METTISRRLEWGWQVATAFLIACMIVFWGPGDFLKAYDWVQFHSFNRAYLLESLGAGRLPFWNPYIYLGRPFLADPEVAALYPTTYLHVFLPTRFALATAIFIHALIGLRGMKALLNEVGGALKWIPCASIAWVLSGVIVSRLLVGNIGYANGLSWLPWLFYYCERWGGKRQTVDWLKLALIIVMIFLSGNPQVVWSCALWTVVYIIIRGFRAESVWAVIKRSFTNGLGICGAFFFAFALIAIQLLPFSYMIMEGNREPSISLAAAYSLNWKELGLFGLATSNLMGRHESDLFVGGCLTLMAIFSLKYWKLYPCLRGFLAVTIVSLVIALGWHTPLFALMCHIIPGMTGLRIHSRTAAIIPLALIVMGALALTNHRPNITLKFWDIVLVAVAVTIWGAFLTVGLNDVMQLWILVAVGIGCIGWFVRPHAQYIVWIVFMLVVFESGRHLLIAKHAYLGGFEFVGKTDWSSIKSQVSRGTIYPPRIYLPADCDAWNAPMAVGLATPGGYAALASDRVWSYLHYVAGVEPSYIRNTFPADQTTYTGLYAYRLADVNVMLEGGGKELQGHIDPEGRAWIVGELLPADSYKDAIRLILKEDQPRNRAYTEDTMQKPLGARSELLGNERAFGAVGWKAWAPERIELSWKPAGRTGVLVLSEAWYPGWNATINGHERPVFPVNGWMRGVRIEPGESQAVFTYHQPGLWQGALVSGVAWIGWGVLYVRARRERRLLMGA